MSLFYFAALAVLGLVVARPLVRQADAFLHEHGGPPLRRRQYRTVTFLFTALVCNLGFEVLQGALKPDEALKIALLLAWGIPLTLLDLRCCWLPLRFTTAFWLSGLLLTALPDSHVSLFVAATSSAGMFAGLWIARRLASGRGAQERIGLGDVHLIAGLAAWLGWPLACLLSAGAFLLLVVPALLLRRRVMPYAPWLFALLAGLAGGYPPLLCGDAYDFLFALPH